MRLLFTGEFFEIFHNALKGLQQVFQTSNFKLKDRIGSRNHLILVICVDVYQICQWLIDL